MNISTNSKLLVLCHDTATGFVKVGWADEFPQGRFIYLDVVCESADCHPITRRSPHYQSFQVACTKARKLNLAALDAQINTNKTNGWLAVPLDLDSDEQSQADVFGSYLAAAMRSLYRLTANCLEAWAVIADNEIVHIQSRRPPKAFNELEYQVWKHHTLSGLKNYSGGILEGKLIVQESGLWFQPAVK